MTIVVEDFGQMKTKTKIDKKPTVDVYGFQV